MPLSTSRRGRERIKLEIFLLTKHWTKLINTLFSKYQIWDTIYNAQKIFSGFFRSGIILD